MARAPSVASTSNPPPPPPHPSPSPPPNAVSPKPKLRASGGKTIYWERYTHLTRELLAWLWDNPADHAILFNKKRDQSALGNARSHAHHKKEINGVITEVIFSKDLIYGTVYATQTERFASAVGSHLARFKFTGEGIDPNNPAYSNLLGTYHGPSPLYTMWLVSYTVFILEEVVAEFPFWEECNCMWHGNPTYDARLFNPAPGTNWMGDFLPIVYQGGTTVTATPIVTDMQVQQLTNWNNTMEGGDLEVEPFQSFMLINPQGTSGAFTGEGTSINDFSMGVMEWGEDEDEEGEIYEGRGPGEHPQPVGSTHMILPFNKPGCQTLSWDNHSAFWMSPYARSPPSVITASTTTSAVSDGASWHQVASSETFQMKGKNMLTQLKADFNEQFGALKTECKVIKTQAYMHVKEIAHLEVEGEKEHREAEKIHKHFMERQKLHIQ
ncbi:hypothetical protein F5J12DRAFT_782105 [Pisolithus orientalis]|uniref:uncharacterized protein n=1 Tax=Pisolithus orientalis TaxID=936130 RepID=UPI0022240C53|nr:uncharacterized protein F5J12DRAFT_782105 [Pisolithus orientalis]KAI6009597.1 hypothetical protein F5J12DRAFT_782105 [Pisolithus orientalis]